MQEKYEQVSNLINLGKDRGFLLFDEVNEILPSGEHTAEEIDELFSTVERNGIRIHQDVAEAAAHTVPEVAEPAAFDPGVERAETDPDLTAGPLDKASDPVRTYLREMGTVPLLTREREVAIAKRVHALEREIGRLERRLRGAPHHSTNGARSELRACRVQQKDIEELNQVDLNGLKRTLKVILRGEAEAQQAKGELIEANLRLVVSIAKKFTNRGLQFLDLIQEGNIGLMRGADKFEWRRGYKFSTYATPFELVGAPHE